MKKRTVDRLRDYQHDDVRAILDALKTHQSVVYQLPSGAGKTVVAARVMQQEVRRGHRVLFIAHRRELIEQARARLIEDGVSPEDIGIIMRGEEPNYDAPIQIASVQTLSRPGRPKPKADLFITDEGHHAPAPSYRALRAWYPAAKHLGLTATPARRSGRPLSKDYHHMVVGAQPSVLLKKNAIRKPRVYTKKHGKLVQLRKLRILGGDYHLGDLAKRVNRRESNGDHCAHWLEIAGGRRTVGYAVNVAHAERMCRLFLDAGIPSEVVHERTSLAERKAILGVGGRLDRGVTKVVWTCMLVTEGWDLPSVKCVILARPTRSLVLYLQMVARAMRPYEERRRGSMKGLEMAPIVFDHFGNALVHGLPHADREWSLTQKLKPGGGAPPVRRCPECGAVVPASAKVCEECKAEMPAPREIVERTDKKLVEVEEITEAEREAVFARVRQVAAAKGADEAWVVKVAALILGVAA